MRNNLTKIFAVMAMSVMSIGMWAIDIPQDLGSYIAIGTVPTEGAKTTASGVTLTNCQVDGNFGAEEYTSYAGRPAAGGEPDVPGRSETGAAGRSETSASGWSETVGADRSETGTGGETPQPGER